MNPLQVGVYSVSQTTHSNNKQWEEKGGAGEVYKELRSSSYAHVICLYSAAPMKMLGWKNVVHLCIEQMRGESPHRYILALLSDATKR